LFKKPTGPSFVDHMNSINTVTRVMNNQSEVVESANDYLCAQSTRREQLNELGISIIETRSDM